MTTYTRRDFIKALVVLGGIPAVLPVGSDIFNVFDAPVTPEMPAGYVEIDGELLKAYSLEVTGTRDETDASSRYDRSAIFLPGRPRYTLEFETYDTWKEAGAILIGETTSNIRIRPAKDIDVVLAGQGRLVAVGPGWKYRFVSSSPWRWMTG
jgi:hypothetical protein